MSALKMATNATVARDYAVSVLASLSEKKLMEFLVLFADENTLARLECEMLVKDPDTRRYNSFEEFMEEMEQEDD